MKRAGVWASVLALGLGVTAAQAQEELPTPSPAEKALADKADHVTEVTLDKSMLAFAAKFLKQDKDEDAKGISEMVKNLRGVYVRDYEFDKDNAYTEQELAALRKYFQGTDWSPMVHERSKKSPEGTDIYVKLVNGQMQGLYVLDAEPKELSLVMILGPIDPDKISELGGNFGISHDTAKAIQKAQKEAGK